MASTLGTHNPLRYRGYVYDNETGLYYLQSRYYNPQVGRFLNADDYIANGQGFVGSNMFAYCNNNSANCVDMHGYRASLVTRRFDDCGGSGASASEEQSTLKKILTDIASPDGYGRTFSAGLSVGATYIYMSQKGFLLVFQVMMTEIMHCRERRLTVLLQV